MTYDLDTHDGLVTAAYDLVEYGYLTTARGVCYFMEKPWKWEPELAEIDGMLLDREAGG